jgi:hypothetical protein
VRQEKMVHKAQLVKWDNLEKREIEASMEMMEPRD